MSTLLITGANRGIGLAMTRHALGRGHSVIATARDPAAATALKALEGPLTVRALDVVDEASLAAFTRDTGEAIDIAILNAGVMTSRGGVEDAGHSLEAWRHALLTNVAGPFLTARAILPNLERGTDPRIAIVSSQMGSSERAGGNAYPYRASKAGASNVAANLAEELKPRGIAVGSYHPGWVRTDMGGENAAISTDDSATGLLDRIDRLSLATTGVFETWSGDPMPY